MADGTLGEPRWSMLGGDNDMNDSANMVSPCPTMMRVLYRMTRRRVARTHGSLSRTGSRVYYFYKSSVCRASGARHAAGSSQEGWPARCQTSRGRTTLQSRALQQVGWPAQSPRARAPLPVLRPACCALYGFRSFGHSSGVRFLATPELLTF